MALCEVKTCSPVSFPGYVTFTSVRKETAHRGGTVVLVKNCVVSMIETVHNKINDQIWIKLRGTNNTEFGFCYIPPMDSQYYSHVSLVSIQEKVKSESDKSYVIIGDMNARYGMYSCELPRLIELPVSELYSYPSLPDEIRLPNDNAYIMSTICVDTKLMLIKNLKILNNHFESKMSYRKGDVWISEVDTCVVSSSVLGGVNQFSVIYDDSLSSDHTPVTIVFQLKGIDTEDLLSRTQRLGDHTVLYNCECQNGNVKKPISSNNKNIDLIRDNLVHYEIPNDGNNIDELNESVAESLYLCANMSLSRPVAQRTYDNVERWERLIKEKDDTKVWRAIDWRGEYGNKDNKDKCQTNDEFKHYFESSLNPPNGVGVPIHDPDNSVFVPVLDDAILPMDIEQQIWELKSDKACGPDGVSPGLLKMLPGPWIVTLMTLFNSIFYSGVYPQARSKAKLFTIFKKGDGLDVTNYRGINVINSFAKVYDMVLCSRLKQWFIPYREQAGAQPKRGSLEHIGTLHMLCDMAKRKRLKLFVTFINFFTAYDLVPRSTLFHVLRRLGCGSLCCVL